MYATSKKSKRRAASSLLVILSASASALAGQVVENADKEQVTVTISLREQNALSVQGRKLLTVIPPQPGILTTRVDPTLGILYFRLTSPSAQTVSVFASDDRGTRYQLLLSPKAVSAQDIILKPGQGQAGSALTGGAGNEAGPRAMSYQKRIKDLMFAMANPAFAGKTQSVAVNKEIPLWKEGRLVFVDKLTDNDFIGETYRLTNTTSADLVLVEQELARPDVLAITIAQHTLAPGASAAIYIIRLRPSHEQQ